MRVSPWDGYYNDVHKFMASIDRARPLPAAGGGGGGGRVVVLGPAQGNYKLIKWITQNNFNAGLSGVNKLGTTVNILTHHNNGSITSQYTEVNIS